MTLDVWYWLLMAIWLLRGLWAEYTPGQPYPLGRAGGYLLMFLLFLLIGLRIFGSPIK